MNTTLVRRHNLLSLLQHYVSEQVAAGAAPKGLEQGFAQHIQISPSMLSQIKRSRPIGDKLARQIESHTDCELGWLDVPHEVPAQPDDAMQAFLDAATRVWQASNAKQKRELRAWLRQREKLQ